MDLNTIEPAALAGTSFECECGAIHTVKTQNLLIEPGAVAKTGDIVRELPKHENVLVLCDKNTYAAAGELVMDSLSGLNAKIFQIPEDSHGELHADERAIGATLIASLDADGMVAIGSGTINDITRYVAYRLGLPYIIVGTAPSMDGFASTVAPLTVGGFKETFAAVHPVAVIADTNILKEAPMDMIAAGLGDMLKWTALADWKLSSLLTGESYCKPIASLMTRAVEKCMSSAKELPNRSPAAIASLTEGLVLSGLAMQMYGDSRPASGSEHHLSHFWEMRDMQNGRPSKLHGDKVGVGALVMMDAYIRFFADAENRPGLKNVPYSDLLFANWDQLKEQARHIAVMRPQCENLLKCLGGATTPKDIKCDSEALLDAVINAKNVRNRYTMLCLLGDTGELEDMAQWLCGKYGYSYE